MNLQEEQPFYKRHKFVGQFVLDGMTTDPVNVVVEFNELEGGRIDGVILDGGSAPEVAQQVFDAHKARRLVSHEDQWPTVEAEQVFVSKVTHFSGAPSGHAGVMAGFLYGDVSETRRLEGVTERVISFRLAGALGALEPREIPSESWTGDCTIKRRENKLDLGVSCLARSNSKTSIYGNNPTGQSVAPTHMCRRWTWDAMCHETSCPTRHLSTRRRPR